MLASYQRGLRHGLPIALGYLSVSFAFGIQATSLGLTPLQAVMISFFNVTSAGQLAGLQLMAAGAGLAEMALTQLTINLRYALMSLSLSQKLDSSMTLPHRLLLSFCNTDEVFVVASQQPGKVGRAYLYGLTNGPFLGWVLGTLLGALAGGFVAHDAFDGLAGAEFELGFDEDGHASAGAQPLHAGGQDEGQGDEGHVPDHQIDGFGDEFRRCGAQIDAFEVDDAGIGAQFFVQLVFAHVHGVDAGGAVLQEAVGEAAGAGPGVQTDEAGHVELEVFQDGQQLVGAAADIALLFQQDEDRIFGIGMPRLVHLERRRAGRQAFGGEGDLAGHDEAAGLFTAFGKPLLMHEGIRALTGYLGTHGRQCSRLDSRTQWRLRGFFSGTGPQGLPKP